jgi:hypothetical protein
VTCSSAIPDGLEKRAGLYRLNELSFRGLKVRASLALPQVAGAEDEHPLTWQLS